MKPAAAVLAFGWLAALLPAADLRLASAESMAGLMTAWARDFTASHPENPAAVTRRCHFSAEAFDALLAGDVDIAPFARELFPSERSRYRARFGAEPELIPVATGSRETKGGTHAIAIFVNAENPMTRLTLAQLRELLAADGTVHTWGDLGLTGEWARRPVVVHGMITRRASGDPPGIVNFLEQRVLGGRSWRTDLHQHADEPGGAQALDLIVRAVASDPAALGYSGFGYAVAGARPLALGESPVGPFFSGSTVEVALRRYPLSRTIYLCVGIPISGNARAFVAYALSPSGQRKFAGDNEGFLPLPSASR